MFAPIAGRTGSWALMVLAVQQVERREVEAGEMFDFGSKT